MTRWLPSLEQIGFAILGGCGVLFGREEWSQGAWMGALGLVVSVTAELRRRARERAA